MKWTFAMRAALAAWQFVDPANQSFPVADQDDVDRYLPVLDDDQRQSLIVIAGRLGLDAKTKSGELSFYELISKLEESLQDLESPNIEKKEGYCGSLLYVVDPYPSKVVYSLNNDLFERSYQLLPDGGVKFGDRIAVERKVKYEPSESAADAIAMPLAQRGVVMVHPSLLEVHPDIQHKEIADAEHNTTGSEEAQPESYDVDEGGTLIGWKDGWRLYVADGHHRRKLAITAKNFVSSRLGSKNPVPVDRHVPVRILDSEDGWTLEQVKKLGKSVNTRTAKDAEFEEKADLPVTDDFEILASDGVKGGLMRVRQRATRADSKNKNRRIYPTKILQKGVGVARKTAQAGAMLSEWDHPEGVKTPDGEKFVDNPDRKTARVDDIEDVAADGWVWIVRTILDTPMGQKLAKAYKDAKAGKGKAPGISTRFKMRGRTATVEGDSVTVATDIQIITFDDVWNPAVDGAGEFELLSDSQRQEAGLSTHELQGGSPDSEFNTSNPEGSTDQSGRNAAADTRAQAHGAAGVTTVNKSDIQRSIKAFLDAVGAKANESEVFAARDAAQQAILKGLGEGLQLPDECRSYVDAEGAMEIAGYNPSKSAPVAILGNATASATGGFAPDVRGATTQTAPRVGEEARLLRDGEDEKEREFLKKLRTDHEEREAKKERLTKVDAVLEAKKDALEKLPEAARDHVTSQVRTLARDAEHAETLLEDQIESISKVMADASLQNKGVARGTTVVDPAAPGGNVTVNNEARPWMAGLDKFLKATDDVLRASPVYETNPDLSETKARRKHNMDKFVLPMLDHVFAQRAAQNAAFASLMGDSADSQEKALSDTIAKVAMSSATDSTALSAVYNQPTILALILVQMFQDMRMLQFVHPFGAGMGDGSSFKFDTGNIAKIASEYFTDAANYGVNSGAYDAGNFYPEDTGIDEATVGLAWLTYMTKWRKGAVSLTHELIRAMGGGPLNYPATARHLMHMSWRLQRAIDKSLADEMLNVSDEYGAVAVANQSYTTGNNRLPDLSVFPGAGTVTVNLNPTKLASAAVAAGDPYASYGANVVAAIRLQTRGTNHASPYSGTVYGVDPIVRPRLVPSMANSGQVTTTTQNPFTISAPVAMVMGYLDSGGQIQNIPGGGTATFAVDWENGVVVFNAGAGLAGAGGVLTTTVTFSAYSYATNFDNFTATQAFATIPAGVTYEKYLIGLLTQMDRTAAYMGSAGRFVKPDMALMSLVASVNVTSADTFSQYQSPKGSSLYPTEDFFAERSGVMMARHNAPWYGADRRILLTRLGSTKYGIETPLEIRGPYPSYDSNGRIKSNDIWYGEQNEVIATPQAVDANGNVLNPVSRTIVLR